MTGTLKGTGGPSVIGITKVCSLSGAVDVSVVGTTRFWPSIEVEDVVTGSAILETVKRADGSGVAMVDDGKEVEGTGEGASSGSGKNAGGCDVALPLGDGEVVLSAGVIEAVVFT